MNEPVPPVTGLAPLFIGVGTVANVGTVLVGGLIGLLIGNRLPERTRTLVTQSLGLITVVLALQNAWQIGSRDWPATSPTASDRAARRASTSSPPSSRRPFCSASAP